MVQPVRRFRRRNRSQPVEQVAWRADVAFARPHASDLLDSVAVGHPMLPSIRNLLKIASGGIAPVCRSNRYRAQARRQPAD